ncbi:dialkylresorcinol condensing enzyme [Gilvimarinus agarilyticus]|uniref:dialkylrecorsinol condensing enzyme n=1 Tax=unclassified Gilvimarinus TaxID=2642066 RepID=UPI001C0918EB|nr:MULTISPECIES: dialkylrecorsinol condensing enzyme [unclassified Gilvimarinus]MBU2885725.1 dialkylresorcinol condensing enzyme [Gilvimarinus agarilyticus]MDO6570585.1 dialkylresorcinol condensing enzyme [Gilvimarinus sp. 2_MG-2023]MDO6748516.1 dialkylresorcinol condensing enzyme [Gilvimarinus sp. 1_MG-2023]
MAEDKTSKRVLVVHYSQTGQLDRVAKSVVEPLQQAPGVTVDFLNVQPAQAFPFPWPMLRFINVFPESAHQVPCELDMATEHLADDYDLVVLAYQVWYLAPSIPISSFLQSELAAKLLANKPVVTVIACRNMWLQAQEKVKTHLQNLGAKLVGNAVLVDAAGSVASFFATPLWVLTGRKGPHWFGLVPPAGVSDQDVAEASRLGRAILQRFDENQPLDETLWQGLAAVKVNDKLIASEKLVTRSFYLWGKLFLANGSYTSKVRRLLAMFYVAFLVLMLLTVVPITTLVKFAFAPFMKKRIAQQKQYYAWPSGED